jgi:hypothetical protein
MSNFGELQARIRDDLNRDDINSQISSQIQAAIRHYRKFPLWFNEAVTTLTASSSASFLTVPSDYLDTVELYIKIGGYPVRMMQKSLNEIVEYRPTSGSQPGAYAYFGDRFELDFEVNQQYEFPLYYIKELATLSASADTSLWTTTGEDLIVYRAEKMLYRHTLKDRQAAADCNASERDAFNSLLGFRDQKVGSGQAKPWCG